MSSNPAMALFATFTPVFDLCSLAKEWRGKSFVEAYNSLKNQKPGDEAGMALSIGRPTPLRSKVLGFRV